MRRVPLLALCLTAAFVAGCGGSSDQTLSVGDGQTLTVPGDVHGVYGELEAILDQLPYQHWYKQCVVSQFKKELSPTEAEALADQPAAHREQKATQATGSAEAACESKDDRPIVDPNASHAQIERLRAGTVVPIVELAESQGLSSTQVACVQDRFQALPDNLLIKFRNGSDKARKVILLAIFQACAKVE